MKLITLLAEDQVAASILSLISDKVVEMTMESVLERKAAAPPGVPRPAPLPAHVTAPTAARKRTPTSSRETSAMAVQR